MRLAFFPNLRISVSYCGDTMQIYMHNLFKCIEDRKLCCICLTCVLLDKWYTQLPLSINLPAARVNDGKEKKGVKTHSIIWTRQNKKQKTRKKQKTTLQALLLPFWKKKANVHWVSSVFTTFCFVSCDQHRYSLKLNIICSVLWMRKLRLREVKYIPEVHAVMVDQGLDIDLFDTKACAAFTIHLLIQQIFFQSLQVVRFYLKCQNSLMSKIDRVPAFIEVTF